VANPQDISHERLRVYTYPDQVQVRIENPISLETYRNAWNHDVHKIVSASGEVNIVEAGWRYIRTLPLIIKKKEFDPEAYYNDDSRSPEDRVHA
jgi:hypothetical protein